MTPIWDPWRVLGSRSIEVLKRTVGVKNFNNDDVVLEAIRKKEIHPDKFHNFGWKSYKAICETYGAKPLK